MEAGKLRFLIEVQEPVETQNSVGEVVKSYRCKTKVWGAIDPLQGEERYSVDQAKATVDTKITIRANAANLTPTMRLKYGRRIFDIDSIIDPETANVMKQVYCREVA